MTREDLEQRLAEYADGQLPDALRARITAELSHRPEWRAQIQRWQSLRRAAQRALERTPVPVGLADRVQAALSPAPVRVPVRSAFFRFGLPGLAAAAAVTFGIIFWPRGAAATVIEASSFAGVHRRCAVGGRHDSFQVRGHEPAELGAALRRSAGFTCAVPAHAPRGYVLDGACTCGSGRGVRVVHVYYRGLQAPEQVVSLFALNRVVEIQAQGALGHDCGGGERHYHRFADADVTLIAWGDREASYVLAGRMPEPELVSVADGLDLAPDLAARAAATEPQLAMQP